MSGIFKGQMGKGTGKKSASYKQGSGGVSYEAAEGLVRQFLDVDLVQMYITTTEPQIYGRLADLAASLIMPYNTREFNPQGFLDTAVHLLAEAGEPVYFVDARAEPDYLIEPVLQALYNLGHNNLIVDPMHPPYPPTDMASYLRGEPGNPLAFSYNGPVDWLGSNVRHCRIQTGGGVRALGKNAESSAFYVTAPITGWTANPEEMKEGRDDVICLPLEFFDKGNTLFVPDESGDWKKLTVEDGMGRWWGRMMAR